MVVVMKADGSPGVTIRAEMGVSSPVLPSLAVNCWPSASWPS
jgi:hypothetical protein